MTETKKQAREPGKPEKVYDDWQLEAIERVENGRVISFLGGEVLVDLHALRDDSLYVVFDFDGTRAGFQKAFTEWSHANEEIEPPF